VVLSEELLAKVVKMRLFLLLKQDVGLVKLISKSYLFVQKGKRVTRPKYKERSGKGFGCGSYESSLHNFAHVTIAF